MSEFVYGKHAVISLITAGRRKAIRLHLPKGAEKEEAVLIDLAQKKKIPTTFGGPVVRAGEGGIAVETEPYPYVGFETLLGESLLLILDEIQDPQNLGALCRSAHLFGVGGVVIPENRAASVGPGACQASVGAVEYLKIARMSSIANCLEILKKYNFWTYGADASAQKTVSEEEFPAKVAVVIGNEEKGLRRLVRERCDILLKIPMKAGGGGEKKGSVDSLNASVSGAVFLYEIQRQRMAKK
jgi:23S rRNA (guanosine2251-2'-O)-methyltransferase